MTCLHMSVGGTSHEELRPMEGSNLQYVIELLESKDNNKKYDFMRGFFGFLAFPVTLFFHNKL